MLGRKGLPGARRDGGRRGAAPGWRHRLITLIRFNFIAAGKNAALFYSSPTVHYYFFVYFLCISECLLCGCVQFGVVFFFSFIAQEWSRALLCQRQLSSFS